MSTASKSAIVAHIRTPGDKGAGLKLGLFATLALADAVIAKVKADGTFKGEKVEGKDFVKSEWSAPVPVATIEEWEESLEEGGSTIEAHNAQILAQIDAMKKLPPEVQAMMTGVEATLRAGLRKPRAKKGEKAAAAA